MVTVGTIIRTDVEGTPVAGIVTSVGELVSETVYLEGHDPRDTDVVPVSVRLVPDSDAPLEWVSRVRVANWERDARALNAGSPPSARYGWVRDGDPGF